MDTQTAINTLIAIVLAVGGWFAHQIWEAVSELRRDLHSLRRLKELGHSDEAMKRIEGLVQRIYDKLDGKADK